MAYAVTAFASATSAAFVTPRSGFEGDEAVAHALADELVRQQRPSQAPYDQAVAAFGEAGLIELTTLIGYYVLISYTLNTFDVALVDGMEDPFPED